jgi:ribonuclease HII
LPTRRSGPPTAPLDLEIDGWDGGLERIAGVDEVGCAPLAGPVVVAAVVLHRGQSFDGAADSKLLRPERREELAVRIRSEVRAWSVAAASCREIERFNVRGATALAMRRAVSRLPFDPDLLLVDGRPVKGLREHRAIVKGDLKSHSIACASIVAKVTRDHLMRRLHEHYPVYNWASNKGYPTREHLSALERYGATAHHRATFSRVAQPELQFER